MPDAVFDLMRAPLGSRTVVAQGSVASTSVVLKTNVPASETGGCVLTAAVSARIQNVFMVRYVGSTWGVGQRYIYFEIANAAPIRVTRIRFRSQPAVANDAATLAIELSDTSDFAAFRQLGSVQAGGEPFSEKDVSFDVQLPAGTHCIRVRATTPSGSDNITYHDLRLTYHDLRLTVEPEQPAFPSVALVARLLAPNIRFHPSERHFPCSVEWFMKRCRLIAGEGTLKPDTTVGFDKATHFRLPDGISVLKEGPIDAHNLIPSVVAAPAQGASEHDDISLCPMEAAPGTDAQWSNEISTRVYFSDYQLETLSGEPLVSGQCAAPCYCRVTEHEGKFRITYFFLCAYNGGMGTATLDSRPLENGFYAHIGDWMRVTAIVSISNSLTTLHAVEYDAHGETTTRTDGGCSFVNKKYDEISRIPAYSAWHSHEMYASAGQFSVPGVQGRLVHDYTGDGAAWPTWRTLEMVDEKTHWISYKGLWGANIKILNSYVDRIADLPTMKNGPNGPALKDWWWIGEPYRFPPPARPAGGPKSEDVLRVAPSSIEFGTLQNFPTLRDLAVSNTLAEPIQIEVQVTSALAADWKRGRRTDQPLYPSVLSFYMMQRYELMLAPNEEKTLALAADFPRTEPGALAVYSPSDFKGYVAINVIDKTGWIIVPVTGAIFGGDAKVGVGGHVTIRDSDIPPLDLREYITG